MTEMSQWQHRGTPAPVAEPWDEALPDIEARAAPRFTLLIRTAKIVSGAGEFLCIIRDVSRDGMKLRTFHPLPETHDFMIEFASGERCSVDKVWEDGDLSGFRFRDEIPIERLLAEAPEGRRKRPVRLRLELDATIYKSGRPLHARFVDISQHGACIHCTEHLAMDERVRLVCNGLPEIIAKVRWRRLPYYGLIFEQTFRFDELARLTVPHQARGRPPLRHAAGVNDLST